MVRVELLVYDLSRGMAAAMSQQILGQRIDGIWHTGVLFNGNEYYYGGGIQISPHGVFAAQSNLYPSQQLLIGETNKTVDELRTFLQTISHHFTATTYDLLRNNCNNFSNEVCLFLLGKSIPSFILDLPNIVFSTPGGAMLRPMIEGMQQSIQRQNGYTLDPFGGAGSSNTTTAPNASNSAPSFEADLANTIRTTIQESAVPDAIIRAELEEVALTSSDAGTIAALGNKILSVGKTSLTETDCAVVQAVIDTLSKGPATYTGQSGSSAITIDSFSVIQRLIKTHQSLEMAGLFAMRLMVLHRDVDYKAGQVHAFIVRRLTEGDKQFSSVAATVMAICVLANLLSHEAGAEALLGDNAASQSQLIEVAMNGMNHTRAEIRQMASALAYNYVLYCTRDGKVSGPWAPSWESQGEIHDQAVQFMCGCFESVQSEQDGTVRKRRLSIICRILRAYGVLASALAAELGYLGNVDTLLNRPASHDQEVKILKELAQAMN